MAQLIVGVETGKVSRRQLRYRLFRIRDGSEEHDQGLKAWFELQFKPGMTWKRFTFEWDVAPKEPLKLITKWEWTKYGGRFDEVGRCAPPAFTEQE